MVAISAAFGAWFVAQLLINPRGFPVSNRLIRQVALAHASREASELRAPPTGRSRA